MGKKNYVFCKVGAYATYKLAQMSLFSFIKLEFHSVAVDICYSFIEYTTKLPLTQTTMLASC